MERESLKVLTNTNSTNMTKKTTQGRKKIEIKKIEEETNRQVTFSKRRTGLFKKASELCVLTGAELAIFVHSPGGRVFAFGHPSTDQVVDKYLNNSNTSSKLDGIQISPPTRNVFNQRYSEIEKELEKEKKKKKIIEDSNLMKKNGDLWWGEESIDSLGLEELEQFVSSAEELKKKVITRADELMMIKSSSLSKQSMVNVNQTPNLVIGLGNYGNMVYGTNLNSLGFEFGHGKI